MTPEQAKEADRIQRALTDTVCGPNVHEIYGRLRAACTGMPDGLVALEEIKEVVRQLAFKCSANTPDTKKYVQWGETLKVAVIRLGTQNEYSLSEIKRLEAAIRSLGEDPNQL